jgi:hypothetical protein
MPGEDEAGMASCAECGAALADGATFCHACGTPVIETISTAAASAVSHQEAEHIPTPRRVAPPPAVALALRHCVCLAISLGTIMVGLAGCDSGTSTEDKTTPATETAASTTTEPAVRKTKESKYAGLANPAQHPDPNITAYCNEVPMGHACHAVTTSPSDPNESPQRNCDSSIVANSNTSCAFAENAFYEAYRSLDFEHSTFAIEAYSPTTYKNYELFCDHSARLLIGCTSSPLSDGIYVSFPQAALIAYTEAQAQAYAASGKAGNPPPPAAGSSTNESKASEPEEPKSDSGEDEVGSYSHAGDQSFCNSHECIGSFTTESGTIVQCSDGSYSHAGGISGACSHHGGEAER